MNFDESDHLYVLDAAGEPVQERSIMAWAQWFETAKRHVGDDTIGESRISTIFLGVDHGFHSPLPILWETMVFGGALDQESDRCGGAREQAEAMHARMVERVRLTSTPAPPP